MLVPTVEKMSNSSVPLRVFREVRIQKIDWYLESPDANEFVLPSTNSLASGDSRYQSIFWMRTSRKTLSGTELLLIFSTVGTSITGYVRKGSLGSGASKYSGRWATKLLTAFI